MLDGLIGCKTGITAPAGPCFSGYYEKDGLQIVIVILNSRSSDARWAEIEKIIFWVRNAQK